MRHRCPNWYFWLIKGLILVDFTILKKENFQSMIAFIIETRRPRVVFTTILRANFQLMKAFTIEIRKTIGKDRKVRSLECYLALVDNNWSMILVSTFIIVDELGVHKPTKFIIKLQNQTCLRWKYIVWQWQERFFLFVVLRVGSTLKIKKKKFVKHMTNA